MSKQKWQVAFTGFQTLSPLGLLGFWTLSIKLYSKRNTVFWDMGLLIKVKPWRLRWGVEILLYSSVTLALDGGGWSVPCLNHFTPAKRTSYALYRGLGGSQAQPGHVWKILHPPGFNPQTVQLIASCYTNYSVLAHDLGPFLSLSENVGRQSNSLLWPTWVGAMWGWAGSVPKMLCSFCMRWWTCRNLVILSVEGHCQDPLELALSFSG